MEFLGYLFPSFYSWCLKIKLDFILDVPLIQSQITFFLDQVRFCLKREVFRIQILFFRAPPPDRDKKVFFILLFPVFSSLLPLTSLGCRFPSEFSLLDNNSPVGSYLLIYSVSFLQGPKLLY